MNAPLSRCSVIALGIRAGACSGFATPTATGYSGQ